MSIQAVVPERELLRLLDLRHLPFLNEFDMRILAAREFGYSIEEMVAGLGKSEATIRRHLTQVRRSVFDFLGLVDTDPLLNHWTRRHFECCTNEAQKMIVSCSILTAGIA